MKRILAASLMLGAAFGAAASADPTPQTVPDLTTSTGFGQLEDWVNQRIHRVGQDWHSCGQPEPTLDAFAMRAQPGSCRSLYYDRVFSGQSANQAPPAHSGEQDLGPSRDFTYAVAIGYFDPSEPMNAGVNGSSIYETVKAGLTAPCRPPEVTFACGFDPSETQTITDTFGAESGTSYQVLVKHFFYRNSRGLMNPVTVRVPLCNPWTPSKDPTVQRRQQDLCAALFGQSLKNDDVTVYMGHSTTKGPNFYPRNYTGPTGLQRFFTPQGLKPADGHSSPPYKTLFMSSCDSMSHYQSNQGRANVLDVAKKAGYNLPRDFGYIGTNSEVSNDGSEALSLLESMGNARCGAQVGQDYVSRLDLRNGQARFQPHPGIQGDTGVTPNFAGAGQEGRKQDELNVCNFLAVNAQAVQACERRNQ